MQEILIKIASFVWLMLFGVITADFAVMAIVLDGVARAVCSILMIFGVVLIMYWIATPYNPPKKRSFETNERGNK